MPRCKTSDVARQDRLVGGAVTCSRSDDGCDPRMLHEMCHSAAYSCSDGAAHCLAAVRRHTSPAPVHRNAVHSTNSSVKCANAAAAAYALRAAPSRSAQHAVRRGALYDRLAREPQPAARPSTAVPPPPQSQDCLTVSQTFGNSRCASGHCWWCRWCGWVSARGSAEGRIGQRGSALRSCTACVP